MTIFMGIICIILLVIIGLLIHQIDSIRDQLRYINTQDKTNKRLTVTFHVFFMDKMVSEINKLISKHFEKVDELGYEKSKIKQQITSISHDLRTPLTSIVGYIDLLESSNNPEDFKKYIDIIRRKSNSLHKLVEDFYEISLIEDKNYELELTNICPYYILEDLLMEYYNDLEKNGVELDIKLESTKEIQGNQNALARVYSNLFSNIKKHGAGKVEIYHGEKNGRLITMFKNRIKEPKLVEESKLFEKFYTGEKSRTYANTGIGMYSSKILLEKMNHKISASVFGNYMTIIIEYFKEVWL